MIRLLKTLIPETSWIRLAFHRVKADLAALRYGYPARSLTVIGITGTDGKTTTVGMTAHILNHCGIKTGALSTAFFQIGETVAWNPTQKTSPSPFRIQKFLRQLVNEGCTHAVIECSSHGLLQGRLRNTHPAIAAITNISEEHLDYHGTMEAYIDAKGILFRMLAGGGTKILNADDRSYGVLHRIPSARTIPYSPTSELTNIHATAAGVSATAKCDSRTLKISLSITGTFNLSNALCAILIAESAGVDAQRAAESLSTFKGVPGRLERIDAGQSFSVFVDFTVTPQSYEATLSTLRSMLPEGKRLLVLCGSCGDRMKEKRPLVGAIVSRFANVMVVANEDPYTENPESIIDDVWRGIDHSKTKAHRIFDRREAITFLLKTAMPGDIVIFCGKGSDITMMTANGQIPWNEREIVLEELTTLAVGGR